MAKHRSFRLTPASEQEWGHGLTPQSPLMRSFKRSLGVLALTGFLASLIIHVTTFFGIVPPRLSWLLHSGIFLVFIPMILTWNRLVMSRRTGRSMAEAKRAHSELFSHSLRTVPIWVKAAYLLCFTYYVGISGSGLAAGIAGAPPEKLICSFSGGWMFFYSIPTVFFFWVEPRAREIQEVAYNEQQGPPSADQPGG